MEAFFSPCYTFALIRRATEQDSVGPVKISLTDLFPVYSGTLGLSKMLLYLYVNGKEKSYHCSTAGSNPPPFRGILGTFGDNFVYHFITRLFVGKKTYYLSNAYTNNIMNIGLNRVSNKFRK